MEFVQPIRDVKKITAIYNDLAGRSPRDALLWSLGIHTGLRISDILKLRVRDVWSPGINRSKTHLILRDKKTGKSTRRLLAPRVRESVERFCPRLAADRFLFVSRQGRNRPIGRSRAYQILSEAAARHGLREVGTHTMRKTFGYHLYGQTKSIALVMRMLNHSNESQTLRYIGVEADEMDESLRGFGLLDDD